MAPHIPAKMPPRSIVAAALLSAASANHIGLPRMYLYGTNVADLSRIDRDQYAIEKTLGGEGLHSASFAKALALYEEGGHSKAYARLHFKADEEGSGPPLDATGVVHGVTEEGIKIDGKVIHEGSRNAAHIDVLYEHQFDGSKCMVGALPMIRMEKTDGCFAAGGTVEIDGGEYAYHYDVKKDNRNGRTIAGFSKEAESKMYTGCPGCPYPEFKAFYEYYKDFQYADHWVRAALTGKDTKFEARGNAAFSTVGLIGRAEAAKRGMMYMNSWMYVIREFRYSANVCRTECEKKCQPGNAECRQCSESAVKEWDEAVAMYTGSWAAHKDHGGGYMPYALAETEAFNFLTFDNRRGASRVNSEIFTLFEDGLELIQQARCGEAEEVVDRISRLMTVPLVQGVLRYAHKRSGLSNEDQTSTLAEMHLGEGAAFAAAALPMVFKCSHADARTIYSNMRIGSTSVDFAAVKLALESNYDCMGITCADVGGIVDVHGNSEYTYMKGAEPCNYVPPPLEVITDPAVYEPPVIESFATPTSAPPPKRAPSTAVASNKAKGHGGKGATVAVAIVSAFVAIGFAAYITRRTRTGKDTSFVDTSFESDTADPEIQPYSGENPGDIQII
jgi:hypothetical protein